MKLLNVCVALVAPLLVLAKKKSIPDETTLIYPTSGSATAGTDQIILSHCSVLTSLDICSQATLWS